nr:hypothetical protein Iba_chr03aCG4000 [Ipomoea batatas]
MSELRKERKVKTTLPIKWRGRTYFTRCRKRARSGRDLGGWVLPAVSQLSRDAFLTYGGGNLLHVARVELRERLREHHPSEGIGVQLGRRGRPKLQGLIMLKKEQDRRLTEYKAGGREKRLRGVARRVLRLCSGGSDLRIAEGESVGPTVERLFIGGGV